MNYHDRSVASVNLFNGSETGMCADSKNISKNPAPLKQNCQAQEMNRCSNSEVDYSGKDPKMSSGKNYEATMIIM
jgi:hypothetical protein